MSNNLNYPTITLPLLIAYTQALLPSLNEDNNKETVIGDRDNGQQNKLLWVVADNNQAAKLKELVINQTNKNTNISASRTKLQANTDVNTLLQLREQNLRYRYDLGCFWLPSLDEEQLQQFIPTIMRYRDLYAAHLLIAVQDNIDLHAYGLSPFDILQETILESNLVIPANHKTKPSITSDTTVKLWQFNLYDYKRLPDWLNNKHWANPENWDKRRW